MSRLNLVRWLEQQDFLPKKPAKGFLKPLPENERKMHENNILKVLEEIQNDIKELKEKVLLILENNGSVNNERIKSVFEDTEKLWQKKKQDTVARLNVSPSTFLKANLVNDLQNQKREENGEKLYYLDNHLTPELLSKKYKFQNSSTNKKINEVSSECSIWSKNCCSNFKSKNLKSNQKNKSDLYTSPSSKVYIQSVLFEHPDVPLIMLNDQSLSRMLNLPYKHSRTMCDKRSTVQVSSHHHLNGKNTEDIQQTTKTIVIQDGKVCISSPEFVSFKQFYYLSWGSVMSVLPKIEKLLQDYSIPLAIIDGNRLVDVGLTFKVGSKLTTKDLLLCIVNREDVQKTIKIPGRRYLAKDGLVNAAVKIQSTWRCYTARASYLNFRRRKWAATIIALSWIMKCKLTMVRQLLKNNQIQYLSNFRKRAKDFQSLWPKIKQTKHTIIHIPSLGYSVNLRRSIDNIATIQNHHIGRFCDIKDPNVEVIYVSPVEISIESSEYYNTLTCAMCKATEQDYEEVRQRLQFITPDQHNRFLAHNLCLSSVLKYSFKTMKRLRLLIKAKQAYIVPGLMHLDDLYVANYLDIPVLGSEPDVVQMYSMKSGIRRIFESSNISVPPGAYDICSLDQLHASLAMLVTKYLHISRWLFKMNDHFDGRGTAYCDILPHLTCYQQVLKEQEKYGENWSNKWAYEQSYNKILQEIPHILKSAVPVDKNIYATWKDFIESFLAQGGVIEAYPPSKSITGITANALIEPDGAIQILSVADQFHSCSPLKCWGYTLPQSSVDYAVVKEATLKISEECKLRGIIGYISIDYVTFINLWIAKSQVLWPVGLKIAYTSSHAMVNLITYFSGGQLENNSFEVTVRKSAPSSVYTSLRKKSNALPEKTAQKHFRYFVFSSNMFHSNLNHLRYEVFFQICKARTIVYNEKTKVGTVFALFDQIHRDCIGMVTAGETLQQSMIYFLSNLSCIHQDISSTSMQGLTNFQGAIDDLRLIIKEMELNREMIQADHPLLPTIETS